MAPFISLLPVRKDKRTAAAPPQAQAPRPASPPPIEFDRFFPPSPPPPPPSKQASQSLPAADMSVVDFSDLLNDSGLNALEMLNEESFGFLGPDETLATVVGVQLEDESEAEEVQEPGEAVVEQRQPELVEVPVVVEPTPVAPQAVKKPTAKPRSSLAPLRAVAVQVPLPPSSPPAPIPVPRAPAAQQKAGPATKRPRASLSRPSHILPKGHPSHPRQSIAFALPPPIVEVQEGTVEKIDLSTTTIEPKRSSLKKSSSGSEHGKTASVASRSRLSTLAGFSPGPTPQCSAASPITPVTTILTPSPDFGDEHEHEHEHEPFPSPSLAFDGDSSLPAVGVPLDLIGVTSTPARPGLGSKPSVPMVVTTEEQSEPVVEPLLQVEPTVKHTSKPRRATMAVTFALPDLEESQEMAQSKDGEKELTAESVEQPSTSTAASTIPAPKLKRRASRAFETGTGLDGPRPFLASSSSRRASRALVSAPLAISSTPGATLQDVQNPSSASQRLTSSLPQSVPPQEPPRTVIRLTASASSSAKPRPSNASRPPAATAPINATVPISTQLQLSAPALPAPPPTTKSTSTSTGLTLPRDFDFLNRGAEREAERKKRTELREKERQSKEKEEADKKKRMATSAWAASSTKELSKGKEKSAEEEQAAKRAKLCASLPPGWPTGERRASTLHNSAPASRQPRSRPSHVSSLARRRSTAPPIEPTADLSSSSIGLTKEALEASTLFEGSKVDLKRRVSNYLEGLLPGVLEKEDDYAEEEKLVEEASLSKAAVAIDTPPLDNETVVVAHVVSPPATAVSSAPVVKKSAAAIVHAPSAARRPLAPSDAHNKRNPATTGATAALPTAVKPTTKVQPFTFGSTKHHSRQQVVPLATASPVFNESLSAWKCREAAAATLGAPPKTTSLGGGAKRIASRALPASKAKSMAVLADSELAVEAKRRKITPAVAAEKAASVKALASIESKQTMWTRTEQRRVEREAWEKKQREREEEVRRLKEQQRMKEAEQERLKLKALKDALVIHSRPIPASTYERRVAKRA